MLFQFGHPLFQSLATVERLGLQRGPGTDAAAARTAGEIGIGIGGIDRHHIALDPHLSAQALPMEQQGRRRVVMQRLSLAGSIIGVEDKTATAEILEQDHTCRGSAVIIDRRQCHGIGIIRLLLPGLTEPAAEQVIGINQLNRRDALFIGVNHAVGIRAGGENRHRASILFQLSASEVPAPAPGCNPYPSGFHPDHD